ncbi:hypothetical protein S726_002190 [Salmonella enterica subsp. enterica]|uniref:Uncharacterized protein n=1 Tax=Salmonella enterica TaxID=28901 RepID=A0A749L2I4_SALER|nr:hypothetical protein [Salmonella enterica subsp. diarizonae serovar 48:i:z]EDQ7409685.1 hypothetical protein [Salmonella enterica subsp. diarizonae]EDR9549879.1 hypothetical protein [Salmonella enterica]EDU0819069.1 hypothetical protein [Salmonella enterica subsp. diarizonae serovar 61:l,[v],[z13]:1,5,[7]]EDW1730141.1 hypothetical protein [Salmonella enterica subsp. enterica]
MRLSIMKGIEVNAPVTKEISTATAWAIRAVALTVVLYGIARLIVAVRWW